MPRDPAHRGSSFALRDMWGEVFRFEQSAVHEKGLDMIFMRSLQRTGGIASSMCRFQSRGTMDGFRNKSGTEALFTLWGVVPFLY